MRQNIIGTNPRPLKIKKERICKQVILNIKLSGLTSVRDRSILTPAEIAVRHLNDGLSEKWIKTVRAIDEKYLVSEMIS